MENIWFVVPAYNEATVVRVVLDEIKQKYANVILVNDGSTDETASIASNSGVHVVNHATNLGQGAALQTGIDFALRRDANFIVTFDADGQHSVDDVEKMLDALVSTDSDIALGTRFLGTTENLPALRRLTLVGAVVITRLTTGLKLTDAHNGLRVLTKNAANAISLSQNNMAHASELIEQVAKKKLRYVEVPVHIRYTDYSLKKGQSITNSVRILCDMLVQRITK